MFGNQLPVAKDFVTSGILTFLAMFTPPIGVALLSERLPFSEIRMVKAALELKGICSLKIMASFPNQLGIGF